MSGLAGSTVGRGRGVMAFDDNRDLARPPQDGDVGDRVVVPDRDIGEPAALDDADFAGEID
jgi:hypothetical protein